MVANIIMVCDNWSSCCKFVLLYLLVVQYSDPISSYFYINIAM